MFNLKYISNHKISTWECYVWINLEIQLYATFLFNQDKSKYTGRCVISDNQTVLITYAEVFDEVVKVI